MLDFLRGDAMTILFALLSIVPVQEAAEDIDAFMKKVLENRSVNWEKYHDYFGRERARLSIEGKLDETIQGFEREYLWFVKDGYVVRSPVSVDGVPVSSEEREREEADWIERLKKRKREHGPDREQFFGFEFEPGSFFYAGRETFEGRDVVVIEYYPGKAPWSDDEEAEDENEKEAELEAKLGKVFFVTMLVDPVEHQVVRMTLENAGFDFLPARWLVHLDEVEVSLTMHQPIDGVWLTRDIEGYAKVTTAGGSLEVRYNSTFYDYGKTKTGVKYRFPPRGIEKPEKPKP
jgi:hypothetical protein